MPTRLSLPPTRHHKARNRPSTLAQSCGTTAFSPNRWRMKVASAWLEKAEIGTVQFSLQRCIRLDSNSGSTQTPSISATDSDFMYCPCFLYDRSWPARDKSSLDQKLILVLAVEPARRSSTARPCFPSRVVAILCRHGLLTFRRFASHAATQIGQGQAIWHV